MGHLYPALKLMIGLQDYRPATFELPDHIRDTPDSVVNETLACAECRKNYRIISRELEFYRKQNLPLPRKCPNCRYAERIADRNPYRLYNRNCAKCEVPILTTYAPERHETVYCEMCFRNEGN